jgi:hypothetical protein
MHSLEKEDSKIEEVQEWLAESLSEGRVEHEGKQYFFREFDSAEAAMAQLADEYGLSTSGPTGEGFMLHATQIENIKDVLQQGIYGVPENPTLSTLLLEQVPIAAGSKASKYGYNIIVVARAPWTAMEVQGSGWPEPIGTPTEKYTGDKGDLPDSLPTHLRDNEDLRYLPPDHIKGFYVVPSVQG